VSAKDALKAWADARYRFLMIAAMAVELLLLAALVVIELVKR